MAPAVVEHPGTRTTDSLEATVIDQRVAPATRTDTRELRALALVQARGNEIVRTGPWTYLVPSCSGGEPYAVNYERETCDCPNFTIERRGHEPGEPCKHVYAVGIHRAKRRGGRAS
jgi:predicted nucleic acid-binding Zn finger protein